MLYDYIIALCVAVHDRNKNDCILIMQQLKKRGIKENTIYNYLKPESAQKLKDLIK